LKPKKKEKETLGEVESSTVQEERPAVYSQPLSSESPYQDTKKARPRSKSTPIQDVFLFLEPEENTTETNDISQEDLNV
jgi:hypothetical protein